MATVLAAARYYREGFSLCLAVSAKRVMVPGGSTFHLESGTIVPEPFHDFIHVSSDTIFSCIRP